MKQHNALALLALLCASQIILIHAKNANSTSVGAKVAQGPEDGYPEQPYEQQTDEGSGPDDEESEEPKCPEPRPADSVKDVYRAYSKFSFRDLAAFAAEQRATQRVQVAPFHQTAPEPAAVKAAIFGKSGSKQAKPAAVEDTAYLYPTSIDQQGTGFAGTTDPVNLPPSEALAVGPHPTDDDLVFVLHAINGQVEIFAAEKDGKVEPTVTPSKVPLIDMAAMTQDEDVASLGIARVAAFYDEHKRRYVLVWTTHAIGDVTKPPPMFVAVSHTQNPLGSWVVWALDLRPDVAQGVTACAEQPANAFYLANLQASYSEDGIFIGAAPTCITGADASGEPTRQELSVLYVMSMEVLCDPPRQDPDRHVPEVFAAMYFAHRAWYRSVAEGELTMIETVYKPFNSYITPARPQSVKDVRKQPLFAMKVSHSHLSIATLTTDERLDKMKSVETAPLIKAVVVGKGADFSNSLNVDQDGEPWMHQPETTQKLKVVGLGMPDNHGGLVYWASQTDGLLYLTTGEYWGSEATRMPSIFWAVINPTDDICHLSREDQGMVASEEGLSLAYPVIAATKRGGAVLAYSYSGPHRMANGLFTAYPGVAMTEIKAASGESGIDIVKQGSGSLRFDAETGIPHGPSGDLLPWGYNSAASVCGHRLWFAVPIPTAAVQGDVGQGPIDGLWYGSWISVTDLSGQPDMSRDQI